MEATPLTPPAWIDLAYATREVTILSEELLSWQGKARRAFTSGERNIHLLTIGDIKTELSKFQSYVTYFKVTQKVVDNT